MIKHIKHWTVWRRYTTNGPLYRILVLFGLVKSPSFELSKGYDAIFRNYY